MPCALEERLDVRLANRTTRSVALTEAGERLHARVAPAFRDIDDALDDLNNFRDTPSGTLRFNAARSSAQMVLLPLVTRFLAVHPQVRAEIVISNALVDLVAEGFDAGGRFGEIIAKDMTAVPLGPRQRSVVFASPASSAAILCRRNPVSCVRFPASVCASRAGAIMPGNSRNKGKEIEVAVEGPLVMNDQSLMLEAAMEGLGVTCAFEGQVTDPVAQGRLISVLEDWCPYYPGFYLYIRAALSFR